MARDSSSRKRGRPGLSWSVLLTAALALAIGGCSASAGGASGGTAKGAPIVVGEDVAVSGAYQTLAEGYVQGSQAYVDYLNAHGGVLGHQLKLVVKDDESTPSLAAAIARELVLQDHAQFILGPEASSTVAAAIPIVNSLHVVNIDWTGATWPLAGVPVADTRAWSFPVSSSTAIATTATAVDSYILPNHLKRVAIISDNTAYGLSYPVALESLAKQYGFKVVSSQIVQPGSTDDSAQVVNVLAAKPQVIVSGVTAGADEVTFIKSIRTQDATIPIVGCTLCAVPSFTAAVGGASVMKNVYSLAEANQYLSVLKNDATNAPTIAETKLYLATLRKYGYGSIDDLTSDMNGWAAVQDLVYGIEKAHSLNETKIREALAHQTEDVFGQFMERTPSNYGRVNIAISSEGLEVTNANGTFSPYHG